MEIFIEIINIYKYNNSLIFRAEAIIKLMMSTKYEKIHGGLKNPLSNMLNPFRQEKISLRNNTQLLKQKFPQ